jgi:hypothetical protein
MSITVQIRDETTGGDVSSQTPLELPAERMSVRDLIRERVYQEVQDFNRGKSGGAFQGLVQPGEAERVLNGTRTDYRPHASPQLDWKAQFEAACDAFESRQFLLIVDARQAESLDQVVEVSPGSEISFLKLTPLVGG